MASKGKLKGKQALLPRRCDFTRELEKDWRALQSSGINLSSLKEAMALLVGNDGPLPAEWKDHELKGRMAGYRECHAGGDLLLVYRLADKGATVIFVRAGRHSDLFD